MTLILSPADTCLTAAACPAFCDGPHEEEAPCFGGIVNVNLSLAEPVEVPIPGVAPVTDYLSVSLWQHDGDDEAVITLAEHDEEIADLTLAEAELLARALRGLVRRARRG